MKAPAALTLKLIGALGVVALSFWATLTLLDYYSRICPRGKVTVLQGPYYKVMEENAIVFVLLVQSDKWIVSTLLPLDVFGHYVLASTIALLPWSIVGALTTALMPRFTVRSR